MTDKNFEKQIKNSIFKYYKKKFTKISSGWKVLVNETLSNQKEKERLLLLKQFVPLDKTWKILEAGSGFGNFLLYMSTMGYNIQGIEPDSFCVDITKRRFDYYGKKNIILKQKAEKLPFANNFFDFIISFQVLEHVQNLEKTLKEFKRVLKKDGYLFIACPNYSSFWEPHYAIIFPMFLGKSIFRLWLRLNRRNIDFLESLNFTTTKSLKNELKQNAFIIKDVGKEIFKKRFNNKNLMYWGQTTSLKRVITFIRKIKLNNILINTMNSLDIHYPTTLVARKT